MILNSLLGEQVRASFQRLQQGVEQWQEQAQSVDTYGVSGETFPAVNIGESAEAWHVYVFAAGIDRESLQVSLQNNALLIKGQRKPVLNAEEQGQHYYRRERFSGAFRRSVQLPDCIDAEHITARYQDGVLSITVAKDPSTHPRRIAVESA